MTSDSHNLEDRVTRAVQEDVEIVAYDPQWPAMFEEEKERLRTWLPSELTGRIEHFGSTAVPGLAAKPIVDMLVEVTNLEEVKQRVVPILKSKGYDYFWRPTWGDDVPPWYAWFIRRNAEGLRTHHIHMVQRDFSHWDRLLFRDYLIKNPSAAHEYQTLKMRLAADYPNDRVAYTKGKTEFITRHHIQALVDLETEGWNAKNPDFFLSIIHPDMVWPWPPSSDAFDPIDWVFVLGRFHREQWRKAWQDLFDTHDLIHNNRTTLKIELSKELDAAFAVVDIDTLWRHVESGEESHWKGRVCKMYTKLATGHWKFYFQTGALDYSKIERQTKTEL
jgi:GrpB-like predicted nucleotidyltransferase (UPF0157 family)/ketosteroid isomerase-like protein